MLNRIFSTDSAKAIKADAYGYLNAIHYLAPATLAGVGNLCGHNSPICTQACLGWTSGRAGIVSDLNSRRPQGNSTRQSRLDKARRFMRDRKAYMADVIRAIKAEQSKADEHTITRMRKVKADHCPQCGCTDIRRELIVGDDKAEGFWICEKCKQKWDMVSYSLRGERQ